MTETYGRARAKEQVVAKQMKGRRAIGPGTLVWVGAFVLILGVLGGAILGHVAAPSVASFSAPEHIYLTVAYDPFTGLDQYFPANFTVQANVPVTITITNYDNGTNQVPAGYNQVVGTVGGTETVTNGTVSGAVVSSVAANRIAHTFTMMSGGYDVSVPIPAAQDQTPTVVSFTVQFTIAGQFDWHCMAYCDDLAMSTLGFMRGTVTVVGQ